MKYAIEPSESATAAIREAIADLEAVPVSDLGTLGRAVDVDDIDALVEPGPTDTGNDRQSIAFRYCGYSIEVYSDRTLVIEP